MDWLDIKELLKDSFKYVLVIVIVLLVIIYIFTFQQVVGPSMESSLNENDIIVLLKSHYRIFDVERFDVISFKYDDSKYLVKRVIGLPGEYVYYLNNKLYINGKMLDEDFLDNDIITNDFNIRNLGYNKIPDDMYLVLGDNRSNSLDSRNKKVGLIKKEDIIGKIALRIFPFNQIKTY